MNPWPLSIAMPLTIAGAVVLVLAFDVAAAWFALRNRSIVYTKLWPFQFGLYVVIGFFAMLALLDIRLVEIVGAITGFAAATVGWTITWRMGPARVANATPGRIAIAVLSLTAFGYGFAIAGALLFNVVAIVLIRARG